MGSVDELDKLLANLGLSDEAQIEYARGILLDDAADEEEELSEVVKSLVEEPSDDFDGESDNPKCFCGSIRFEQIGTASTCASTDSFPAVLKLARTLRKEDQAQQERAAEETKARQKGWMTALFGLQFSTDGHCLFCNELLKRTQSGGRKKLGKQQRLKRKPETSKAWTRSRSSALKSAPDFSRFV